MRIRLDITKSLEKNASVYFDKAKKAKKKADGARKALEMTKERQEKHVETKERKTEQKEHHKKEWFENFKWFISSDGFLCVGGKDASSNEAIVKKYSQKGDLVFHTDMSGSPFVVIKADGKEIPQSTKEEAAQFTASYSRAWRQGYSELETFAATPDQLSKTPESGEYLNKGAFIVRGDITYFKPVLGLTCGKDKKGRVMFGPKDAILTHCKEGYEVLQGNDKTSDVAKRLAKLLDVHPDDIIPHLPAGGVKMGRRVNRT